MLFTTLYKYNGVEVVPLPSTEIHQIAGRAGRFGLHEVGQVGVLLPCDAGALRTLRESLAVPPTAPPNFRPTIGLGAWHIRTIADTLQLTGLSECVDVWSKRLALAGDSPFSFADTLNERFAEIAAALDLHAPALTVEERFAYATSPVPGKDKILTQWC